jgi:hypothetical protein
MQIKKEIRKPVLCVLQKTRDDMDMEILRLNIKEYLEAMGIPQFQSIERAAAALSRLADYGVYLRRRLH